MKKSKLKTKETAKLSPTQFLRGEAKRMFAGLSLVQKNLTSKNELYRNLRKAWKAGDKFDLKTLEET